VLVERVAGLPTWVRNTPGSRPGWGRTARRWRWRASTVAQAAASAAVVVGRARGDLAWAGAAEDADRDRCRAGPPGVDGLARGAPQQRTDGYRAARADRLATAHTARPRPGKLAGHSVLRGYVEDRLKMCRSPRQISKRLVVEFSDDPSMRVSRETIYTSLFV
jgi:hypothetical protein